MDYTEEKDRIDLRHSRLIISDVSPIILFIIIIIIILPGPFSDKCSDNTSHDDIHQYRVPSSQSFLETPVTQHQELE